MQSQSIEIAAIGAPAQATGGGCGCSCGQADTADVVLDVHTLPRPIRHAAVLGALGAIAVGRALVLVSPHEPVRLLAQIVAANPDAFVVSYLEQGPDAWQARLERIA